MSTPPDPDADEAANAPCAVTRAHIEAFQAWMIETGSMPICNARHITICGDPAQILPTLAEVRPHARSAPQSA